MCDELEIDLCSNKLRLQHIFCVLLSLTVGG